jgi:glycosyltransferase involved in cell wall biosynthesis
MCPAVAETLLSSGCIFAGRNGKGSRSGEIFLLLRLYPLNLNPSLCDIILPCFRPSGNWKETILAADQYLRSRMPQLHFSFILVNDGTPELISPEDLHTLETQLAGFSYVVYEKNQGKGHAIRMGLRQSSAPICLYTDLDFPYDLENLKEVVDTLQSEAVDLAIGIKGDSYYEQVPPARVYMSRALRWLSRQLLQLPITDTQCGLKGFSSAGREVYLQTTINRYLCDLECIFLSSRRKDLRLQAVPLKLRDQVVFSNIGWRILLTESLNFASVWLRSFRKR